MKQNCVHQFLAFGSVLRVLKPGSSGARAVYDSGMVSSVISPNFNPVPLTPEIIGTTNGPVFQGAQLFQAKACLNCHLIEGHGGRRGPDLTFFGSILTKDNLTIRIVNGGVNMPAFGATLKPGEIADLVAYLDSRKRH